MPGSSKIKFAIIGCGHIGKRHAAMILENKEAELAALCDIRKSSELGLDNFKNIPFFNSLESLLDSGLDFDVVNICTPNGLHSEQSILALDRKKHVVCEKPMGLSSKHCEEVIKKSKQVLKHVFCVMQNRYSPPAAWLKQVIDTKLLGKVFMVQINCYWNRDSRYYKKGSWKGSKDLDGGTLFTQFSHFIDILYWLFGDIERIKSQIRNFNHEGLTEFEDSGIVTFDFINGGMGCLNFSTAVYDKNLESSITIIGENGSIKVGGQYMNEVKYCHIKNYQMPLLAESNPPNDYGDYKGSASNHHYIIENVIDTIKGRSSATTNASDGLKVVDIIERIYKAKNQ
jgi:predicted dehydrogenase